MLDNLERAKETARRTARGDLGRLCVGVTSTTPFNPIVPRTIRAFCQACPKVELTVEECLSNESIDRLKNGDLDAAFIRTSLPDRAALSAVSLIDEPFVVALSSHHPLLGRAMAALPSRASLKRTLSCTGRRERACTTPSSPAVMRQGSIRVSGAIGASTQRAPRIGSTLSLVAAGLAITLVPESLQRLNLEGVVYRRIKGKIQPRALLNLATRRGDPSPVLRQFISVVRNHAAPSTAR